MKNNIEVIHVINHSEEHLGGAQKILRKLVSGHNHSSKILSFDFILSGNVKSKSNKLFCFCVLLKELIFNKSAIFVFHHRIFLLLTPILDKERCFFICHNIFPTKNFIFRFCGKIRYIAVSEEVSLYLNKFIPIDKIITINNGVSFSKEELQLKVNSDYIISYIGRLSHQKGVDVLIKSFALLLNERPDSLLKIVGDGEELENILELIEMLDIKSKVIVNGFSHRPFLEVKESSVLVVPSRYEGFGLVFYEALEREHFVVASDLDVFKLKEDDSRVQFFSNNSISSLYNTLLACSDLELEDIVYKSRTKRHDYLTEEEMIHQYMAIFGVESNEC